MRTLIFILIAVVTVSFSACKTKSETKGSNTALTETTKEGITEKYWKLVEINGKAVEKNPNAAREAHIILKTDNNRLTGSGGCNVLSGGYELNEQTLRIKFSQVVSTMMACSDMEVESQLLKVLGTVDNYSLSADGNTLSLNKAKMAPLARFEVVYLK